MKNNIDFLKIQGGELGVINFNNMIPIHMKSLTKIDLTVEKNDTKSDKVYKNLLINQREWCNSHKADIYKKAQSLYRLIKSGKASEHILNRCCNFEKDEEKYLIYISEKGWSNES